MNPIEKNKHIIRPLAKAHSESSNFEVHSRTHSVFITNQDKSTMLSMHNEDHSPGLSSKTRIENQSMNLFSYNNNSFMSKQEPDNALTKLQKEKNKLLSQIRSEQFQKQYDKNTLHAIEYRIQKQRHSDFYQKLCLLNERIAVYKILFMNKAPKYMYKRPSKDDYHKHSRSNKPKRSSKRLTFSMQSNKLNRNQSQDGPQLRRKTTFFNQLQSKNFEQLDKTTPKIDYSLMRRSTLLPSQLIKQLDHKKDNELFLVEEEDNNFASHNRGIYSEMNKRDHQDQENTKSRSQFLSKINANHQTITLNNRSQINSHNLMYLSQHNSAARNESDQHMLSQGESKFSQESTNDELFLRNFRNKQFQNSIYQVVPSKVSQYIKNVEGSEIFTKVKHDNLQSKDNIKNILRVSEQLRNQKLSSLTAAPLPSVKPIFNYTKTKNLYDDSVKDLMKSQQLVSAQRKNILHKRLSSL